MRAYIWLFHTVLLQEVRKNPDNIHKGNVDSNPLTEKDIYPKAWEEKKPNKQTYHRQWPAAYSNAACSI